MEHVDHISSAVAAVARAPDPRGCPFLWVWATLRVFSLANQGRGIYRQKPVLYRWAQVNGKLIRIKKQHPENSLLFSPVFLLMIIGNLHFPPIINRYLFSKICTTKFLLGEKYIYTTVLSEVVLVFLRYVICLKCVCSWGRMGTPFLRTAAAMWTEKVFSNPNRKSLYTRPFCSFFTEKQHIWMFTEVTAFLSKHWDSLKQTLSRNMSRERKQGSGACFWARELPASILPILRPQPGSSPPCEYCSY